MNINFTKKIKLIWFVIHANYKLILLFGLFLIMLPIITLIIPILDVETFVNQTNLFDKGGYVQPSSFYVFDPGDNLIWSFGSISIASLLNFVVYGLPSIILIAIFTLLFINVTFIVPHKKSSFSLWMTIPMSRVSVFLHVLIGIVVINVFFYHFVSLYQP